MNKECIKGYLEKLEENISEYMELPVSVRSTEAVESMTECWQKVKMMYDAMTDKDWTEFTEEDAETWNRQMVNVDGSSGGHWTIQETNGAGRPADVPEWAWNVAMNMMYSDYAGVAQKYGISATRYYADMASAFLNDADACEDKLAQYYKFIVK